MAVPRVERACLLAAALLAACAAPHAPRVPEPPTLKSLAGREVAVQPDDGVPSTPERAARAYQDFLRAAPRDPQRQQALRRLGDLEMDRIDARIAAGVADAADYRTAIARYQEFLKTYPNDPGNDRVLYQMARAYDLSGELEKALATLDRLVEGYPRSRHYDEAQFRRGEMLFALRQYGRAEQAFAATLSAGADTPYYERALYMHGWSLFKQGKLQEALHSFFTLFDIKLGDKGDADLAHLPDLTRADREVIEDTFRVTSLALEGLQGAATIPQYMNSPTRRGYEFRVYEQLGELYLKQDRIKDAADTFAAFALRQPQHARAPVMQARVIDIYALAGFQTLALEAKKNYVAHYGVGSEFARANPQAWQANLPRVRRHLEELARHYHAAAQKSRQREDYQEAVRWYRAYLQAFPDDPQAAQNRFLLAELLFEDARFAEATQEYEAAAYGYPPHAKSADAGYAALLAYAELERRAASSQRAPILRAAVDSALRFAAAFEGDARVVPVLTDAAEKLYALQDLERAAAIAQQVVALQPPPAQRERRVAWTVIAHTAFEREQFERAERAYLEVLTLVPEKDPLRGALQERLAAAVYKQGEAARGKGALREAVGHFMRVAAVAPASAVRATAQYDAAAALLALQDWDAAARLLEDFRSRFPKHPLQEEVSGKLAVAYVERGQWARAAAEFERLVGTQRDAQLARAGLWQAAELYEKARQRPAAAKAYERYLAQYPQPLEAAVEARYRLARLAREDGNTARELHWMREVQRADAMAGAARTDRTRYLAALATLTLAQPVVEEYRKVALVEPLKQTFKLKKTKFEQALKAYAAAAEYGVAEVTTAATFHTAELYHDFGRALLSSQRPKRLSKLELEQYNVMLEEQAFPFEEKAIELHEVNARRTASGIYDEWVKRSFASLARLRPARYAKVEVSEATVDAIR
ncbi:MAG: tetratricopeptide repeat protein [Sutterellaceae bacterium]|nr:tetratricopeptide repeat protein [Burkholderiaceae bacterium]MDW8428955.1 tetratricopeptide repeat protein [Sutterellaceae bacterium]